MVYSKEIDVFDLHMAVTNAEYKNCRFDDYYRYSNALNLWVVLDSLIVLELDAHWPRVGAILIFKV